MRHHQCYYFGMTPSEPYFEMMEMGSSYKECQDLINKMNFEINNSGTYHFGNTTVRYARIVNDKVKLVLAGEP
jgi:hypothetical protein